MTSVKEETAGLPSLEQQESRVQNSYDEKRPIDDERGSSTEAAEYTQDATKPFPIDPNYVEETHQLTIRALFVGCCLGAVVGASNIYLGLKTGFTFGPQLFGAIFGFAIIKPLSRVIPESGLLGRFLGGSFGPKENCTVQSAATAAGGMGILFVSAVPAMYRLELLSALPKTDAGKLIALTVTASFFGVFFVIPLRKYYIIQQKLVFPTPAATAFTIRSLHSGAHAAVAARKKSLMLLISLVVTFVYKVVSGYAPGILYDWHVGWTLYRLGFTSIIALENYGWWIEFTPAFFGAGMLSGINASWSFLGGSVLAWGIIAPSLVATGKAFGAPISEEYPLVSYQGLSFRNPELYRTHPSPRYWLLWPGVLIMLVYSFMDLAMTSGNFIKSLRNINWSPRSWFTSNPDNDSEDDTPIEDRVPTLWWASGLTITIIMCCAILATMFSMNVGEAILALLLGFLFSFIGVQSSGTTDVNPVGVVAKGSQLILGGIGKASHLPEKSIHMLNLAAGVVSSGSAAQATDMTGDLKTGYLLRAKPKNQFIAQIVGSVVAIFLNVGLFILFTTATPCIISGEAGCTYSAPSVASWAAVSIAVSSPSLPIPPSSGFTAIGLAIFAALTVVVKHMWIPKKYHVYIPNWNAIGLGFVVPQVFYAIAMGVGSIVNFVWQKRNPANHDMYMFALGAGLLAGEGLGGVFQALLAICKVDGGLYGTAIGCPGNEFCG